MSECRMQEPRIFKPVSQFLLNFLAEIYLKAIGFLSLIWGYVVTGKVFLPARSTVVWAADKCADSLNCHVESMARAPRE